MSVTEAQYSTVSHPATRYQKHSSTKLDPCPEQCVRVCVCPWMHVHSHVNLCMCFCGLTAIAPGLINILVSHEDIGAYRQPLREKARCVQTGSVSTTQFGPCLQQHRPFHHDYLHAWTKGEWLTMSTTQCTTWKPRLGFDPCRGQALCLAQNN